MAGANGKRQNIVKAAAPKSEICLRRVVAGVEQVEEARLQHGISVRDLARRAGIDESSYYRFLRGANLPRPRTLRRLLNAVADPLKPLERRMIGFVFRGMLAATAQAIGLDLEQAAEAASKVPDGGVPGGFRAMQARREAIYLMATGFDVRAAEIARGLGVSRQAVSRMVAQVEAERDAPEIDARLEKITAAMRAGA